MQLLALNIRLKIAVLPILLAFFQTSFAQPIDRKAVVERHTITVNAFDSLSALSVGNGGFAFTVDATGLQTFPDHYANGVPLGTQSEWGWHSFPNTNSYREDEFLKTYPLNGRDVKYGVQWNQPGRSKEAADYFRQNLHRLQLGNIGFEIIKKDKSLATVVDISDVSQVLNMWTGEIHSKFTVEGVPVDVITFGHQVEDAIAVRVHSALLTQGRLKIRIRFPYPTGNWDDVGNNWNNPGKHSSSVISQNSDRAIIQHRLDTTSYYVSLNWSAAATIAEAGKHYFLVTPARTDTFQLSCKFSGTKSLNPAPAFAAVKSSSETQWPMFWRRGAAIDFAGSTDDRAAELERRIVTSLYLTKLQCAGSQPPQETGLTYNSWYGKPHLEMHWWHGVHFALWGRQDLLEKSLNWYENAAGTAYKIAKRQGYEGLRWQKMTDPAGREAPSSIGAMLIWQQPHFIYMAELCYRTKKDEKILQKYKNLVFATADFMASFAYLDPTKGRYILGKGVIPAQERYKPEETYNSTYELAYWYWGLNAAQQWRERLHLGRNRKWDEVMQKLSPLPVQNNLYLLAESATDSHTNPVYKTDHPSVLGTLGMLPKLSMTDTAIMRNTFDWIWNNWAWKDTWGWDFPMVAMTATRLGIPEKAIDALMMPIKTNTYLINGHNYQDERLRLYLPGNGGLLTAIAMMCAGYDDNKVNQPGFPKNGKWKVKCEGFNLMP
jgi:hypothetical protein